MRNIRTIATRLVLAGTVSGIALQAARADQGIETVTVTAERRAESIQDVPASISAYDQASITSLDMTDVQDLARLTPGLSFTRSNGDSPTPILAIRGISSFAGTATTGVYIDDTPIQVRFLGSAEAAGSAFPTLFDLNHVEVLRGPQGTLFGSSSEGGTVRFITQAPSLTDYSGHARAEIGVNPEGGVSYELGLAGGGPIIDNQLGFRVSAYAQGDGGWVDLQPYPGTAVTEKNSNSDYLYAVDGSFTWQPVSALVITPSVFWQREHFDNISDFWENLSNPSDNKFVSGQLTPGPTTDDFVLSSMRAQYDFGGATLISNTSYLNHTLDEARDYSIAITELLTGNYTGPHTLTTSFDKNPQRQFTQEFRLQSSDSNSPVRWVIGGFYQEIRQSASQVAVMPPQDGLQNLITAIFGVPIPVPLIFGEDVLPNAVSYEGFDHSRDTQLAGFGQVDYSITKELTLTAGLRIAATSFSFVNAQDGPFNSGPSGGSGRSSENDVLPKGGITYKPDDNLMFYATVSKGFRPGGANTPVPTICDANLSALGLSAAPETYGSDHVWSYEVGSKGEALDDHLVWDASAYYINWAGIQNTVYLPQCGFHYVANLGAAVSRGFDAQVTALVTENLTVGASIGYDNAYYSETTKGVSAANIVTAGEPLQAEPWQFTVTADYSFWHFGQGSNAYLHIDDEFRGAYHTGNPLDANFNAASNEYGSANLLAMRLGVRMNSWDFSVFAKNLADAHPKLGVGNSAPSALYTETTFAPRVVGVTANVAF